MSAFEAGVGVRDITPPAGVPLWGYMDRKFPATGMLDPLQAKAVAFRANGVTVVLLSLDLGRVPAELVMTRIRQRARKAGVDYVFMSATHTHHAPVMELADAPYMPEIERALGDAVEEAFASLQPVRIALGQTRFDIGHNRRKILEDGRCFMLWRNEQRMPTEPVDQEATLIRIETIHGKPVAVLVHFACHPVVMGPSNLQYSADYVGEMARIVKEHWDGECVFLQGACGDINPYLDKTRIEDGAVETMREVGRECAGSVLDALAAMQPTIPEESFVAFYEKRIRVGTRWDLSNPRNREFLSNVHGWMFELYAEGLGPDLEVPLSVVLLNRQIALVGMPGEIFVQFQLDLKRNSPAPYALLCGYTNGYYAYFPTVHAAATGGYGGIVSSFVGVGAGERLAAEAAIEIGRMMGRLGPDCDPADFVLLEQKNAPQ